MTFFYCPDLSAIEKEMSLVGSMNSAEFFNYVEITIKMKPTAKLEEVENYLKNNEIYATFAYPDQQFD